MARVLAIWAAVSAFLKGWGALVLGATGFILGIRSELRARREHRWKLQDREKEAAREKWCLAMADRLRQLPMNVGGLPVDEEHRLDALWGHSKFFLTFVDGKGHLHVRLR